MTRRIPAFSLSNLSCLIVFLTLLLPPVAAAAGTPHIVYGSLSEWTNGAPPDDAVRIDAFAADRPGEALKEDDVGCGYENGMWYVEAGNLPTAWREGDELTLSIRDVRTGKVSSGTIPLSGRGVQAVEMPDTPAPGGGDDDGGDSGGSVTDGDSKGGAGDTNNCFIVSAARSGMETGVLPAAVFMVLAGGLFLFERRRKKATDGKTRGLPLFLIVGLTLASALLMGRALPPVGVSAGSHTYSLEPGWNGVALLYEDSGIGSADELVGAITGCDKVRAWDPLTQAYITHEAGDASAVFPFDADSPYFVHATGTTSWSPPGETVASPIFDLQTTATTSVNAIVISPSRIDVRNAGELAATIPYCEAVWRWDAERQGYVGHPRGTGINNFAIEQGAVYFVSVTDPGTWQQSELLDYDHDGDGFTENQGDCNDAEGGAFPGGVEVCDDGIDNDCDGAIDCADDDCAGDAACDEPPVGCTDADGDGYYAEGGCGTEVDCDDSDETVHPGAVEICGDGIDQDCDGEDPPCIAATPAEAVLTEADQTIDLTIQGGTAPYSVSGVDGSVATATLEDGVLSIAAVSAGTTSAIITDAESNSLTVPISVTLPYTVDDAGNRVMLGPIENATVSAYRLSDVETPIETTTSGEKGRFDLTLSGVEDAELVLITATGGQDIDADDDGMLDPTPTELNGTVHALAAAGDVRAGKVMLSALSEMAWQFTKHLAGITHPEDIEIRLNDIAGSLFKERLSDEGEAHADLARFNPIALQHRDQLNFNYADMTGADSVIAAIHQGLGETDLRDRIEAITGAALSFNTDLDSRRRYARIRLVPSGEGQVQADVGGIQFDSGNPAGNVLSDFYEIGQTVVFEAQATENTAVHSWTGCDGVSQDQTRCEILVREDAFVAPAFVYKETLIAENVVDMSAALITPIDDINYRIQVDPADAETLGKLESLSEGDVIVSSQPPYYILGVVAVARLGAAAAWVVETEAVALEDIIEQGSAVLRKRLTHADLASEETDLRRRSSSADGVRLLPPERPGDDRFRFVFGEPAGGPSAREVENSVGLGHTFTIDGVDVTISGELAAIFDVDWDINYSGWRLRDLKLIPTVTFKEDLEVEFKGKIKPDDEDVFRVNLRTIPFAKQPFNIGIIPGYISYEADVNLVIKPELESSASAQAGFTQELKGGFTWNENSGLDWVKGFKHSSSGVKGNLTTKLKTKVYVEIVPRAAAYSIIGPEMSLDAGLKFVAGAELNASAADVTEELFATISFFAAADLKAAVKDFDQKFLEKIFGRFRELLDDATNIEIMGEREWPIKEWRVVVGAIGEQPPFLEVEGDRREYRAGVENTGALPDVLATYVLTNTGGKDLEWEIEKSGRLFDNAAWIDITPWGALAPEESATAKIVWQDGFAKADLAVGDYRGTLDFIVKGRENYPDAQTGATRREIEITVDETLDPGSVSPVIDQWPDTAPAGSKFVQKGSGFTPNSPVVIHVRRDDGSTYTPDPAYTDSAGNFYVTFKTSPHRTPGDYVWWAEDITGALSSELTYTITAPGEASGPTNFQDRESGVPGTDFVQWGYGFTPNGAVTIRVRHPDDSETIAETVTADPEGWFYTVYSAALDKPSGTYRWWAVDETTGRKSGELSYTISGGGPVGDTFTNDLGMTFVRIPAGTFMMGSPEDELGAYSTEWPRHQVTLTNDFYMMTTEVTQAQWEAVMGSNPSYFDECGGNCPVEKVSWHDVQDFIAALNARDSRIYRLPTEAEWEYAARAGTTTAFYNGNITQESCDPIDPNLDAIGWYCGNSGSTTHAVAQKQPNAWGLYDMSGNVWEWCQDWHGAYPDNASVDPGGPSDASYRVIRGGSWYDLARYCRSASRLRSYPTGRSYDVGFRLALSPGR